MIDTRPLWARALASRGSAAPRRPLPRLFMESTRCLTDQQVVDLVRALMGQRPLYAASPADHKKRPTGLYVSLEALCRLATAGCERCGGSGYYDGERLDMRCPCTGMKQRDVRPLRPRVGDPSFAHRGRQI